MNRHGSWAALFQRESLHTRMREILRLVPKPSHFAGAEWGAVRKDHARITGRVALAFPDLYEVGMSYLGQKILYEAVNRRETLLAERVYAPSLEAAQIMREHGATLTTLESDTPLAEQDMLAFHLTHELCYTNVLFMLDLAGLPLYAAERGENYPLVVAGGGCTFNAEPVAPFFDVMVLGDGEEILPRLLEEAGKARRNGVPRRELLLAVKDLPGVYIPAFFDDDGHPKTSGYGRVEKAIVPNLDDAAFPIVPPMSCGQAVHDRMSVEVARGCTRGCRFCQAGMIYRPVRERGLEKLAEIVDQGLTATGYEELSFLSLSTGDFSALESLFTQSAKRCLADQVAISLPSLRAGTITPPILALMAKLRRTGATVAPEAGSERLRQVINKGLTESDILGHAAMLFAAGWQSIKLYFMIGLPTETDDDLLAIADLAAKVLRQAPPRVKRLQVTVSVSTLVPKPHTPFQWTAQLGREETKRRLAVIKQALAPHKKIAMRWHEPRMTWLEGVFSRGDRSLAPAVERAYRLGALFSGWVDKLDLAPWEQAFRECGVNTRAFLAGRDLDAPLPWDHLSCGVKKSYLKREWERALAGAFTSDCRFGACQQCGACAELCKEPDLHAPGVRPRVNAAKPQWMVQHEPVPDEKIQEGPPKAREEMTRRAGHYRVWYAKSGPAAFLSQLELGNLLGRALRRSGLKPSFSSGFHPLPLISFGWALPVGVESRQEWFALFLREAASTADIKARLGSVLPEGLTVTGVEELGMGRKVAQPVGEEFLLTYLPPDGIIPGRISQWREFMAKEHFPWFCVTKRGARTVDIRPLVASLEERSGREIVLTFSWLDNRYVSPLKLVGAVNEGISPKDFTLTKLRQIFS